MLKLTRVVLHNICQHTAADIRIAAGLNAVTGRNAGGKTNLLRAIAYGLTGKVDGTWGAQQKLQTDGTFDPGFVEVYFEDDGKVYRVRRFSTSGVKFPDELAEIVGDKYTVIATRRSSVDAKMTELLGVGLDLFFQIMWGRQGELDHMLTAPSAIVNSFLSTVFDTRGLEKLRDALKGGMDGIAQLSPQCKVRAEEAAKELETLPDLEDLEKQFEEAKADSTAKTEALKKFRESSMHGIAEHDYLAKRDSCFGNIALYEQQLGDLVECQEAKHPDIPAERIRARISELEAAVDTSNTAVNSHKLQIAKYEAAQAELRAELTALDEDSARTQELLAKKDSCCSLCAGQIVDEAKYYSQRCNMLTGFDTTEAYLADVESKKAALEKEIAKAIKSVESYNKDIAAQSAKMLKLKTELQAANTLLEMHTDAERYDNYVKSKAAYESWIAINKAELEKLEATPRITDAVAAQAEALEQAVKTASTQCAELERALIAHKTRKEYLLRTLNDNNAQVEQLGINIQAQRVLTELRDALSSKRAQLRYLRGKIQDLNNAIACYFEEAQMPFTLYLDPDTHLFMYKTADGFIHPAAHLSGAQKSIASVVLQMGILTVARPNMNLFMTDEPSEALDVENKFIQAQLFGRLSAIMPAIEGVMLIVTRDTQLIEACGNNIELQGGSI